MRSLRKFGAAAAVAGAAMLTPNLQAQEAGSAASFDLSLDATTHYLFRGLPQENQGLILQPAFGASFAVDDATSVNFGIWNSFHENQTAAIVGASAPIWYEADLSVGLSHQVNDLISVDLTYIALTSPNSGFATVEELDLGVNFDVDYAPYVLIAWELQNGADSGPDEGIYLELGATLYETTVVESKDNPVTLSVPLTLGFSLGNYYEGPTGSDSFGFYDIGADFSTPATFIDSKYGAWDLGFGVHYAHLGTQAARFGAGITGGKRDHVYATIGLSSSF